MGRETAPMAEGTTPASHRRPAGAPAAGRSWTVLELLRWTTDHFAAKGIDTPRLDAECLLAHALGQERLQLYVDFEKPVEPAERARFRELVRLRGGERRPVAQLTGVREFWSLPLRVTPDVLVPRPETETLVQAVLDRLPARAPAALLDVGTGTGAVALALARERPALEVTATDVSEAALAVARGNAEALGLADRVRFRAGSLYAPVSGERFAAVVSNPPYLAEREADGLAPELAHEPPAALFAGPRGDEQLRALVDGARAHLDAGGVLALELAPGQAEPVVEACRGAGLVEAAVVRDLAGRPRVVTARAPGEGEA